jgi:hypothetical protein
LVEVVLSASGVERLEHSFSIEMKSKRYVKNISISDEDHNLVLFQGFLGDLKTLSLVEGKMLEVKGSNGILRIDLSEEELRTMKPGFEFNLSSEMRSKKNKNEGEKNEKK